MADKLTSRQHAELTILEALPPKFVQMHRLIEEIAGLRADDSVSRRLSRVLDECRAATNSIGLNALTETMGMMSMMARRTSGLQMKIRGLREGLASLKVNYEGALRIAKMPVAEEVNRPEGAS